MVLLTVCLLGFGAADLVRWQTEAVSSKRTGSAWVAALVAVVPILGLGGFSLASSLIVEMCLALTLAPWMLFDLRGKPSPEAQVGYLATVIVGTFACGSLMPRVSGELGEWYSHLPFAFVSRISPDQFLLGVAAFTFALATSNRVVRLVLNAAGTPAPPGEGPLKGGRLLGPMERIFVGAMVISGSVAAAGALIAAKGLLRLPEIRRSTESEPDDTALAAQQDHITEYFLIGTFASLLLACLLAVLISAAS